MKRKRRTVPVVLVTGCLAVSFALSEGARKDHGVPASEPAAGRVGGGAVFAPRPYEDMDAEIFPVPVFEYRRGGFFVRGVTAGWVFRKDRAWAVEVFARPSFGGFEPDDSPAVAGMEERRPTAEGAIRLAWERSRLGFGLTVSQDLLGRHEGREIDLALERRHRAGRWLVTPGVAVFLRSAEMVDYYFGVRPEEAIAGRPAYAGHSAINQRVSLQALRPFGPRWALFVLAGVERYGDEIVDSPIVSDRTSVGGFAGVSRSF